jgi:plastocyanin
MLRKSLVLASLFGVAAAVATGAFGQRTATTTATLNATVGPGFTITLRQHGKAVKSLKAGSYTFAVSDKSTFHSFALDGPKLEKDFTTVPFKGTKTVTLKLKAGKYKFYCAAHESTMFGRFSVT